MNVIIYLMTGLWGIFSLAIGFVVIKVIVKRKLPSNNYTPFDYITAQSNVEFHDEKQEQEDNEDQGDDKNKNLIRLPKRPSLP